jgi:hypothetical protein
MFPGGPATFTWLYPQPGNYGSKKRFEKRIRRRWSIGRIRRGVIAIEHVQQLAEHLIVRLDDHAVGGIERFGPQEIYRFAGEIDIGALSRRLLLGIGGIVGLYAGFDAAAGGRQEVYALGFVAGRVGVGDVGGDRVELLLGGAHAGEADGKIAQKAHQSELRRGDGAT